MAVVLLAVADNVHAGGRVRTLTPVAGRWAEEAPLENGRTWLTISPDGRVHLAGPNPCAGQLATSTRVPNSYRLVLDCGDGPEDRELQHDRSGHLRLVWTAADVDDFVRHG